MVFRCCAAAFAALLISTCLPANAQVFNGRGVTVRAYRPIQPGAVLWQSGGWHGPPPPYTNPGYYQYLNERYPKFYGGFHSNYFHNMGLPPGDIGVRGNGIYPTPW